MIRILKINKGQNLLEYTIILGVVVTIFIAMGTMIKRNAQGMIRTMADQIGTQNGAEQIFNEETGYVTESIVATSSITDKFVKEGRDPGVTDIFYKDAISTHTETVSILGVQFNQN